MDAYEATQVVMSRIQNLDPENASKIMGYILIQDQGEEIIRLAFVPESLLLSYINQAKARLGIPSNTPSSNPPNTVRPNSPLPPTPRLFIPNNGFHFSNPSSPADGRAVGNYPIMGPSGRSDSLVSPYGEDANTRPHPFRRRSYSVGEASFLEDGGGGFGRRHCMCFGCKNGTCCKFFHGDIGKGYSKCMDLLNENRNEFSPTGLGASLSSRQIYLTFPADSTFMEEHISNYFNMFGPVQDVRIPHQHKRMFGFVTFVYPETVNLILAKGNPHFVCDSRVLVKPYKEKGKVPEKIQHYLDLSPSRIDFKEHIDLPYGPRMLLSTQEMMLRRKLEQEAELQHAIELQGRRMMNLQLTDLRNQPCNHRLLQSFRTITPISSPRQSQLVMNQSFVAASDGMNLENFSEELDEAATCAGDDSDLPESFLPDNLFASPTKSASRN